MSGPSRSVRLRLDRQGRRELAEVLSGLLEELSQIEAESAERVASDPEIPIYESKLAIATFPDMTHGVVSKDTNDTTQL